MPYLGLLTSFLHQFSLISEDGTFACSAVDSSYSRLRTTIGTIVQDFFLGSTDNDDNDDDGEDETGNLILLHQTQLQMLARL